MRKPIHTLLSLVAACAVAVSLSPAASAMTVAPMVLEMSSVGQGARQSFKVTNPSSKPLAVEIGVLSLELGPNGEQATRKAGEDFLIYPPQAMIQPGASQVFRVQWIGQPDLPKGRTYRLDVGQLPVQLPKGANGIQIVMSFGVTVTVAPPQGRADIVVLGASPVASKNGKRLASITVKNPGNTNAYLKQAEIVLSGGGWSVRMTPAEIEQRVGLGIVQPGKERRFILPVEVPGSVSRLEVKVESRAGG